MSGIILTLGGNGQSVNIAEPKLCKNPLQFVAPQFTGKSGNQSFAVGQNILWQESSEARRVKFGLVGAPEESGMEFKGHLTAHDEEITVKARVRNVTTQPILSGSHSLIVDARANPAFHDPTGERTFLYAETGWASLAQLVDPIHSGQFTIRMGATYNALTVMWKMIARFDPTGKHLLGFALDKGFAFAGDHPEWPPGLLGGYRWGSIAPQETKELLGKIYLFAGTLNDLRMKYIQSFK